VQPAPDLTDDVGRGPDLVREAAAAPFALVQPLPQRGGVVVHDRDRQIGLGREEVVEAALGRRSGSADLVYPDRHVAAGEEQPRGQPHDPPGVVDRRAGLIGNQNSGASEASSAVVRASDPARSGPMA
jgi:hypothetical protein